jgi:drug/metabolite transporter (DMT)-like permease
VTQTQAIICALASFFAWVLVDTGIKLASEYALSPFMIMGVMGVICAVGVLVAAAARRNFAALHPLHPREQFLISLCSLITNFFNVIALKHLPLTIFYIVVFTAPLIVAVLASLLKHETLTKTKIACLIAGFAGIVIAVGLHGEGGGEWIGYASALIGTTAFAVYTITIRKIAQTDTVESIQLSNALAVGVAGILGSLPMAALPDMRGLAIIAGAGVANLIGNFLYNKALHHTSSTNVAQIHYTQIISGALIAYLIWHEIPTWNLVAGSLIIIASGVIVTAQARKLAALMANAPR